MREVYQRDPPHKCHIVAVRIDKSTVRTKCGITFEAPGDMALHTFTYDPEKPPSERTYVEPVPEARCQRCPW